MALGRGLESLIPPQEDRNEINNTNPRESGEFIIVEEGKIEVQGLAPEIEIVKDNQSFNPTYQKTEPEEKIEGTIITSEIAPGRIRNLRDYVVPKKKIVCKVLRISGNRIDLSLRRVTQKEKKEVLEQFQQEKKQEHFLQKLF